MAYQPKLTPEEEAAETTRKMREQKERRKQVKQNQKEGGKKRHKQNVAKRKEKRKAERLKMKEDLATEIVTKSNRGVNAETVHNLASKGFSPTEIANICGVSFQHIYKSFPLALARGRAYRTEMVMDKNFNEALNGNDKALERELKMAGKLDQTADIQINVGQQLEQTSTEDLLSALEGEFTEVPNETEQIQTGDEGVVPESSEGDDIPAEVLDSKNQE